MVNVTLPRRTWVAMRAILLTEVVKADEEGDTERMIELLAKLAPVLRAAGMSEELDELEDELRDGWQIHATERVQRWADALVTEVEDADVEGEVAA